MARDDRQRRRGEGRIATSQHRRLTHWRPWHHGLDEARAWIEAARLFELGGWRTVADPVMAGVATEGHDVPERRRAPTRNTSTTKRGGAEAP